MLVFGFERSAQLVIAAGSPANLRQEEIDELNRHATEVTAVAQVVRHAVSSAFRVGNGQALMLGVPVAEPEWTSGRTGLCVVFAVFVSRRRVASAAMFVQMIAALELAISEVCSGSYSNPVMTATTFTQLLQRHNFDAALESSKRVTEQLSLLFTSILRARVRRRYGFRLHHWATPAGWTLNNSRSSPYYAVLALAAHNISRTGQLCYYAPFTTHLAESRLNKATPANLHLFLESGVVMGYMLPRTDSPYRVVCGL